MLILRLDTPFELTGILHLKCRITVVCDIKLQIKKCEKWTDQHNTSVEQRKKCPFSVWAVMGLIPVGDSDFFVVPCSSHFDQFTFHISLPSLNFTIFIHLLLANHVCKKYIQLILFSHWEVKVSGRVLT